MTVLAERSVGLTAIQRKRLGTVGASVVAGRPLPPRLRSVPPGAELADLHARAACADVEPLTSSVMLDATSQDDGAGVVERLCAWCPVAWECLVIGRLTAASGVWGGVVLIDGNLAAPA